MTTHNFIITKAQCPLLLPFLRAEPRGRGWGRNGWLVGGQGWLLNHNRLSKVTVVSFGLV
ncbi:hypothetical protein EON65_39245 [archaeon]|nr:MAG: hypothetical protein EON65_39245 [archaeon]